MNHRPSYRARGVIAACLLAGMAACAPARTTTPVELRAPEALPALPVPQITMQGPAARNVPADDPFAGISSLQTVTLRAQDVDVRALLMALAEAAGLSLVVDPGIEGRMTVHLMDVPAVDALREVLAAADLSVATPPPAAPWGPVVFYALPVDIDVASAELIQERFGVSEQVARWIVQSRD